MSVAVGQQAPEAVLVNGERKAMKVSELRGKPTVLAFFPAAFTGTCTKEMCRFRDDLNRLNAMNAQVFGISADTPFVLAEFAKQHQLTFPLLSDFNHQAMKAFGVYDGSFLGLLDGIARRSVFVLDKSGKVAYVWLSDAPGQEPPYDEVQAAVQKVQ
ncbi:MAG TPA: peroxiredoxin [bacterium]|nr:peroxiredoxin [bacterium]